MPKFIGSRRSATGRSSIAALAGALAVLLSCGKAPDAPGGGPAGGGPSAKPGVKNVILMISDGAGFNTFAAASCHKFGEPGKEAYDSFPEKYACTTPSADRDGKTPSYDPQAFWGDFKYARKWFTDSSAAATALYTGVKTFDEAISVDHNLRRLKTIFEIAKGQGRSAGVVTSVPLSHATPACAAAHVVDRDNYIEISTQMIHGTTLDVVMGCGDPDRVDMKSSLNKKLKTRFDYVGGEATWEALRAGKAGGANPWRLLRTKAEFDALAADAAQAPRRVIGVPPCGWTLQLDRPGEAKADAFAAPFRADVPTLAAMATGALNVLGRNPKGFCLMIEGGAVDTAAHFNQWGRLIEEQIAFNDAVRAVVAWVESHSNWDETLLIVTADHETGNLWGPNSGAASPTPFDPIVNNGKGRMPGAKFHSGDHTNTLVPLFAKGAGAQMFAPLVKGQDPVYGRYVDNTDVFKVMNAAITGKTSAALMRIDFVPRVRRRAA